MGHFRNGILSNPAKDMTMERSKVISYWNLRCYHKGLRYSFYIYLLIFINFWNSNRKVQDCFTSGSLNYRTQRPLLKVRWSFVFFFNLLYAEWSCSREGKIGLTSGHLYLTQNFICFNPSNHIMTNNPVSQRDFLFSGLMIDLGCHFSQRGIRN